MVAAQGAGPLRDHVALTPRHGAEAVMDLTLANRKSVVAPQTDGAIFSTGTKAALECGSAQVQPWKNPLPTRRDQG